MPIHIIETNAEHPDFIMLIKLLDAYLAVIDGEDHAFYSQFNASNQLKHVVVAYNNDTPVGCGALKLYEPGVMEIKRMYVQPALRGQGLGSNILQALEQMAIALSVNKCILETGKKQVDAVQLYLKNEYQIIPNYGQYEGVEDSICFEKQL